MSDFIHPEDFDFILQTTPYHVWMWLEKEMKYKDPYSEQNPLAIPPVIWDRHQIPPQILEHSPDVRYNQTVFYRSRDLSTPLPNAEHAYFALREYNKCYKEKDDRMPSDWYERQDDVIRIALEAVGKNLTRVVGDYESYYHIDVNEYMIQIRDLLVKEFSVVEYKNGEPKESAIRKVRGPNSATIKAIEKLFEYRQTEWDGGFGDMPYWTDVCKEVGISSKTAKKYAPNLHENFRDKNYRWDWSMEDIWWEDNSS